MTEVTPSELKMLYIEILVVAVVGVFMFLYNASPITQSATTETNVTQQTSINTDQNKPWSTTLVDSTLGLPLGFSAIIIVSSIFLIPMTIMNVLTLIRIAKDLATQWL